jgi:hypothetical protein
MLCTCEAMLLELLVDVGLWRACGTLEELSLLLPCPPAGAASGVAVTEDTKRKVDAAKSYIENMYRVQYQNIQERYAR